MQRSETAPDLRPGRRSFLKAAGFTLAAGALAGCSRGLPAAAIPFLETREGSVAGRAVRFATLCDGCPAGCGVLAKIRDGRPVLLEGNPDHPASRGGLCAVGPAGLLGLYDTARLAGPEVGGRKVSWGEADEAVRDGLASLARDGRTVRFLTGTVTSPTVRREIGRFLARFPDGAHVEYDVTSASAHLDAAEKLFGTRALPRYRLGNARAVVAFDADFLGPWFAPVEHTRGYSEARSLAKPLSSFAWHVQVESRMTVTGGKADRRILVAPEALPGAVFALAAAVAGRMGAETPFSPGKAPPPDGIAEAARRLVEAPRGSALVLAGTNGLSEQLVALWLNHLLGAHEGDAPAMDLSRPSLVRRGSDDALAGLLDEIAEGKVGALFVAGANPVYDLPGGEELAGTLHRVGLVVSFARHRDETAQSAGILCPDHHALEGWGDAEAADGLLTVRQPAIRPLFSTRSLVESLRRFAGGTESELGIVRESWREGVHPRAADSAPFDVFWNRSVHDGFAEVAPARPLRAPERPDPGSLEAPAAGPEEGMVAVLYPKAAILDGRHAENPWLQELPDPVTKAVWDNYACLSPATAGRLSLDDGDVVRIRAGADGPALELPVLVQPGQHDRVVAVAIGYGRAGTERFAAIGPDWLEARPTVAAGARVGVRAAPLMELSGGRLVSDRTGVTLAPAGRKADLARSQHWHTLVPPEQVAGKNAPPRDMVRETTLAAWRRDPSAGSHGTHGPAAGGGMWAADFPYEGHHWDMAIDLSACTGCASCVIACQAENNIPVVGKDEIRRSREMQWLRVDRYFSGEGEGTAISHQPLPCQHCDHAPCESVCPVLATVHSEEGLNQQVYNRCVGTRYCANNCPYKVRRFNWFTYSRENPIENLVLNPDVTVRTRGVMEKCTFCVQRIQEARAEARREGRPIRDGDVTPACAQSCPAGAIVFGDGNDAGSRVSQAMKSPRAYRLLEELNTRPSVAYLTVVRDRQETNAESRRTHG